MATVALGLIGDQLQQKLGDAKSAISYGLKQQSLGDVYAIKDSKKRLSEFVRRVKSGEYQPTRVDESGRLAD